MVESSSLENCRTLTGTVGSNPTLSATITVGSRLMAVGSQSILPFTEVKHRNVGSLFENFSIIIPSGSIKQDNLEGLSICH